MADQDEGGDDDPAEYPKLSMPTIVISGCMGSEKSTLQHVLDEKKLSNSAN